MGIWGNVYKRELKADENLWAVKKKLDKQMGKKQSGKLSSTTEYDYEVLLLWRKTNGRCYCFVNYKTKAGIPNNNLIKIIS